MKPPSLSPRQSSPCEAAAYRRGLLPKQPRGIESSAKRGEGSLRKKKSQLSFFLFCKVRRLFLSSRPPLLPFLLDLPRSLASPRALLLLPRDHALTQRQLASLSFSSSPSSPSRCDSRNFEGEKKEEEEEFFQSQPQFCFFYNPCPIFLLSIFSCLSPP